VHECQTPVFIWAEVVDGRVRLAADVAPEAPTVKGFVSILVEAFSGAEVDKVLSIEPNLVQRLGLAEALGMMRMRGLQAIFFFIKKQILTGLEARSS
jgi:cysteine desulfuration protein SufE